MLCFYISVVVTFPISAITPRYFLKYYQRLAFI
jgi:hypothetical protein